VQSFFTVAKQTRKKLDAIGDGFLFRSVKANDALTA
jgi:hypothetical protein